MSGRFVLIAVVILAFGVLTGLALADVGYLGILLPHFQSWGGGQVLADLVIMGIMACIWMVNDARARGQNAWPFVALTLALGSFGPLLYLALRELRQPAPRAV